MRNQIAPCKELKPFMKLRYANPIVQICDIGGNPVDHFLNFFLLVAFLEEGKYHIGNHPIL